MTVGLPVSRLINIQTILTPQAAQGANFNSALVLGTSDVIDTNERLRNYGSIGEVANDFGTTAPEYLWALLWFEQKPQPSTLQIGRWAKTATSGLLRCGVLSAAQQLLSIWTPIATGAFGIQIDGAATVQVTNLDFTGVTNLNGVASVIGAALIGHGATCVWDATYKRFVITSNTTGALSEINFLTAPGTGANIAAMMLATAGDLTSGAYTVHGLPAETALSAVALFDLNYNSTWYGLSVLETSDADDIDIAGYIEAANPPHYFGVSTTEAGVTIAESTADIASALKAGGFGHTCVQWSSSNEYSVASYLSRILTTDWTANNSTITLMYKQEPGIVAETINSNQADAIDGKNCNVFATYQNDAAIIQNGKSSSGDYTDTIIGLDWLANQVQTDVFNFLYTSATKVPQTDAGNHMIATVIENALYRGVNNGLIAPGQWNSAGFGQLKQGGQLDKGFYVFTPPISSQSQADREARKSVTFQIAVKLAGAIHTVDAIINVNR